MSKIILDLCGGTGAWSKPYAEAGYDVRLVTLPEQDVRTYEPPDNVYGILAAPPCTMFSFVRTSPKIPRDLNEGMETVIACLKIIWKCQSMYKNQHQKKPPLKFWALENPYYGSLKWFLGKPVFLFDPYNFGDMYKKRTAMWGDFETPIKLYTEVISPLLISPVKQQTPKFDNMRSKDILPENYGKLDRKARRSITPPGFAKAFFKANQ